MDFGNGNTDLDTKKYEKKIQPTTVCQRLDIKKAAWFCGF